MSNYNNLKTTIDANIKQNGNQEITGPILNSVLNQMVNILGTGYQFAGVATLDPATDPGTPDAKVFYIANGKGTYTNFGSLEVTEDEMVVLYWDSAWHKVATGIASQEKLSELGQEVSEIAGVLKGKVEISSTDALGYIWGTVVSTISAAGWEQKLFPVSAGMKYKIHAVLTMQGTDSTLAAIAFVTGWTVGVRGDVIQVTANTTFDGDYTPSSDGYIAILSAVSGVTRASNVSVIGPGNNYIDLDEVSQEAKEVVAINDSLAFDRQIAFDQLTNYLVSSTDGSLIYNAGQSYTIIDLIGKGYQKFTFKTTAYGGNYGYGFFLSDNSWVGVRTTSVAEVTVDVPEGAKEFRLCWSKNQVSYQEIKAYGYIQASSIENGLKDARTTRLPYPLHFDYGLNNVPTQEVISPATLADYYALFDAFVTSNPTWVSKVDCSEADTHISASRPSYLTEDMPIYMYRFSPLRTQTLANNSNKLKVMLVGGTHSNETMGMYILSRFFDMLNTKWKDDENMTQLRTMVDFYVFPCINPWGYVYRFNPGQGGVAIPGRANGNGVNLNRNFPTANWVLSGAATDSDSNYSGPSAGSEYETQVLMYYADQIKPDAIFDIHTGGMTSVGAYGSVEVHANAKDEFVAMAIGMGRGIINRWVKDNTDFPQGPEASSRLFDVNLSTVAGELHRWAYENICKVSVLTEESIFQGWENGVLNTDTQTQEYNTSRIWKENLESMYNTILRISFAAALRRYTD